MEQTSHDVTLTVAKLAALFASLVAAAYAEARIEPSPVIALFLTALAEYAVPTVDGS
jgi:hypothetical protein